MGTTLSSTSARPTVAARTPARPASLTASSSSRLLPRPGPPSTRRTLPPGGRVELPEDLGEVIIHGARAEEQPCRDLAVRGAPRGQDSDLRLLRGEIAASLVSSLPRALAGRGKFGPGALGEGVGSHP